MKVALCGYGRMGQEIERLINEDGTHQIVAVECKEVGQAINPVTLAGADVVIDFTAGELMPNHIKVYAELGINAVIGTTGWDVQDVELRRLVDEAGTGVIVGANFSAGAQIFFQLVALAARQFHRVGGYDVYGLEVHHTGKKDSPSGTAKTIANTITENFPSKTSVLYDRAEGQVSADELHFASVRGGRNPGHHQVVFDSAADEIQLTHSAHSREGFAAGAILAAEYINGKKGFMLFEELFQEGGPYAV